MGFLDFFRHPLRSIKESRWKELGAYQATFTSFGGDMYQNDIVRASVRALATHTSKANAKCKNDSIERLLNIKPNMYMTGTDMLKKVRSWYELKNAAFIYIQRDDRGNVTGFYPVPYSYFEAIESAGRLFIKFYFLGDATRSLVLPWEDLAPLRKDYFKSDIAGDDNSAILAKLELITTTEQGIANAVKATANLRGILKSTKSMLDPEDVRKQKDQFVNDYLNLANEGGIASLDASQEFTPITMSPTVTNSDTLKGFREDIERYFGVNDAILMGTQTEEQMEAFYESAIEPFLVTLSVALTNRIFSEREQSFGNSVVYEANRLQFASMKTKIAVYKNVVLYGGMTRNEWRIGCNMAPVEGGDEMIMRLDAAPVDDKKEDEPNE